MRFSIELYFLLMLLCFSLIIGCSKENNPTGPVSINYLWIHFEDDSTKLTFNDLPKIDADGEEAIQLSSFIDTTIIPIPSIMDSDNNLLESRFLYAYRIVGDDGFSASTKGYLDNTWDQMQWGHIMTQSRQVIFPDEIEDLPGAYNVKQTRHIYINRKFDVETPDTTLFFNLNEFVVTYIDSIAENAIPLQNFVPASILATTHEDYIYSLWALDGYVPPSDMTWSEFQTGYWLLESKQTMFTAPDFTSGKYKVKALEKIIVKAK